MAVELKSAVERLGQVLDMLDLFHKPGKLVQGRKLHAADLRLVLASLQAPCLGKTGKSVTSISATGQDDVSHSAELREKVARIIDPHGWATHDRQMACIARLPPERHAEQQDESRFYARQSLIKADGILALLSAQPVPEELP